MTPLSATVNTLAKFQDGGGCVFAAVISASYPLDLIFCGPHRILNTLRATSSNVEKFKVEIQNTISNFVTKFSSLHRAFRTIILIVNQQMNLRLAMVYVVCYVVRVSQHVTHDVHHSQTHSQ